MARSTLSYIFIFLLCSIGAFAQNIQGELVDGNDASPLSDVNIRNIYTDATINSDADGKFLISAAKGQLLEFRKLGYKITRVRIPVGMAPSYYKIIMEKGPIELPAVNIAGQAKDYHSDSLRFRELYKHELDFPKLSTLDMIQHPFSALSKRNREIWAFQKEYDHFQKEKYIDYTFNEKLVTNITGLKDDSLTRFMVRFRPTYDQLRSMNEYTFYSYIRWAGERFRNGSIHRGSR